jgi:hypothetical protein
VTEPLVNAFVLLEKKELTVPNLYAQRVPMMRNALGLTVELAMVRTESVLAKQATLERIADK